MILVTILFILLAVAGAWALGHALKSAPEGLEDETGFHFRAAATPPPANGQKQSLEGASATRTTRTPAQGHLKQGAAPAH